MIYEFWFDELILVIHRKKHQMNSNESSNKVWSDSSPYIVENIDFFIDAFKETLKSEQKI